MDLTGDEIATTLIMERQTDPRLALIVEGEEECALIDIHLNFATIKTQLSRSKSALLRAAELLLMGGHDWALALIDADFDRLLGLDVFWPTNVVATAGYDLLMDSIEVAPHNVEAVAISHSQPGQVQAFRASDGIDILEWVKQTIHPVGAIRWLVVSGEYEFSARDWPFNGMCEASNDAERIARVASHGHQRSGLAVSAADLDGAISRHLASPPFDISLVRNGHDFLSALAELIRSRLGGHVRARQVAATCRVALSCSEFRSLPAIADVESWARGVHGVEPLKCA